MSQPNTNCLIYIPEDIKLELSNSTLTLKAGSKVYVPNGFESDGTTPKFDVVNITSDITFTASNNGVKFIQLDGNYLSQWGVSDSYSGSTAPTTSQWMQWYDTTNNTIKRTPDSGSTWSGNFSLPIAIVTISNGAISSIDQVFNGFVYIGSTVFALPGVKGLIPNGFESNGKFKVIENTITSVKTYTYPTSWTRSSQPFGLQGSNDFTTAQVGDNRYYSYKDSVVQDSLTYVIYYDKNNNLVYKSSSTAGSYEQYSYSFAGYISLTNGKCSDLRIQSVQSSTTPFYVAQKDVNVYKLYKENVRKYYKYVSWTQPVLTGYTTSTDLGNITVSATSDYGGNCQAWKIMIGSVSSTTDNNYWQLANSNNQESLTLTFPYKLKISSLKITTRPRDNYTRSIGIFNSEGTQIGSTVNCNAALREYTVLSNGSVVTNTLTITVFAGSGDNTYFGLQNLQIVAQRITESTSSDYDYYEDVDEYKAFNI